MTGSNPAAGTWYDAVYLSLDTTWDVSDPLVGRVAHAGVLAAGANYAGTLTPVLPAGMVPGAYHFIVRSDVFGNVRDELREFAPGAWLGRSYDAATGRPYVTARGAMNRDYHIGADPNFPEPGMSGRR